ncbi:glycine cleavage system protein H [Limnoglobus roseus]|uniref:Glycine cleavage system protein H n=1 Tax=Limnoglobus roseus TaxID=2598579 RepID=A0A5C1AE55_9BACT|nr:glycine cleavage system protein H [Limnoglobus roseus]QEL16477.1 glycine cleavage system protein H [Limnoglobus roseus]
MAESLTFMMGKFAAHLPADRRYCRNHMWCEPRSDAARFGFSSYAVRLMQDVYFLEWKFDAPRDVAAKQELGFVESSKAQSELYAPLAGSITQFNATLLSDPSAINADGYGDGWLFEMTADTAPTLSAAEYYQYLDSAWATAQRILKNQVNLDDE